MPNDNPDSAKADPTSPRALPHNITHGYALGSIDWIDVAKELPDDETTVLVALIEADGSCEVWLGYHDNDQWLRVDSAPFAGRVYAWAHVPEAPPPPQAIQARRVA